MAKSKLQILLHELPSALFIKFLTLEDVYGGKLEKLYPIASEQVATPEVEAMPSFKSIGKERRGATYTTPDIYTTVIEGVLYWPAQQEILLTPSRQVIAESCMHTHLPTERFHLDFKDLLKTQDIERISGCSAIFRNRRTWAHALIHNIPRCHLLNQPEYTDIPEIKLLCSGGLNNSERHFVEKLIPPNVTITSVPKHRLYYIEKLIFPSFLCPPDFGYLPAQYLNEFRAKFLPKRESKKNRRLLISRIKSAGTSKGRHILNEDELFGELSQLGFEKCMPEDFSISEQIELFYDAEMIIGAHGAALTNILFSEKTNVLELYPMRRKIRPFFYYLSKSLGHQHRIWYGNERKFFTNFRVNVSEILQLISSFKPAF